MKCRSCGADIKFIKTVKGKAMPVEVKQIWILTEDGELVKGYLPHWSNCPGANEHRKEK